MHLAAFASIWLVSVGMSDYDYSRLGGWLPQTSVDHFEGGDDPELNDPSWATASWDGINRLDDQLMPLRSSIPIMTRQYLHDEPPSTIFEQSESNSVLERTGFDAADDLPQQSGYAIQATSTQSPLENQYLKPLHSEPPHAGTSSFGSPYRRDYNTAMSMQASQTFPSPLSLMEQQSGYYHVGPMNAGMDSFSNLPRSSINRGRSMQQAHTFPASSSVFSQPQGRDITPYPETSEFGHPHLMDYDKNPLPNVVVQNTMQPAPSQGLDIPPHFCQRQTAKLERCRPCEINMCLCQVEQHNNLQHPGVGNPEKPIRFKLIGEQHTYSERRLINHKGKNKAAVTCLTCNEEIMVQSLWVHDKTRIANNDTLQKEREEYMETNKNTRRRTRNS